MQSSDAPISEVKAESSANRQALACNRQGWSRHYSGCGVAVTTSGCPKPDHDRDADGRYQSDHFRTNHAIHLHIVPGVKSPANAMCEQFCLANDSWGTPLGHP